LANDDGARADDHDGFDIGSFWHDRSPDARKLCGL